MSASKCLLVGLLAVQAAALPSGAVAQDFWLPAPKDSLLARARADSNDAMRHYLVGLAHMNDELWDEAESSFRTAIAVAPRFAPSYLALSILPFLRDQSIERDLAKGEFKEEWEPIFREAYENSRTALLFDPLVRLEAPGAPPDTNRTTRVWYYMRSGRLVVQGAGPRGRGSLAWAFSTFQWLIEQPEGYGGRIPDPSLWRSALRSARQGRFEPGVQHLLRIVRGREDEEAADSTGSLVFFRTNDMRYVLAYYEERAQQLSRAIRTYQRVLAVDLGFWMAHVRLANLHERYKRWDRAIAERERALQVNPGGPGLMYELGVTLAMAGRLDSAAAVLQAASEANPRDAMAAYQLGAVAWLRNDAAGARQAFERFLALAPSRLGAKIADVRLRLQSLP